MKTIKRRLLSLVLAMAMVLTLAPGALATGNNTLNLTPPNNLKVGSVTSGSISVTGLPSGVTGDQCTWNSADTNVVTVDKGTVTVVGAGTSKVTASYADTITSPGTTVNYSGECTVSVGAADTTPSVTKVELSSKTLTFNAGVTTGQTLTATVSGTNVENVTPTWDVQPSGVVTLSATSGKSITVTPIPNTTANVKTATITVTAGTQTDTCSVTVQPTSTTPTITLTPAANTVAVNKTLGLTVATTNAPAGATVVMEVTSGMGTVTGSGSSYTFTPSKEGTVTITAKLMAAGAAAGAVPLATSLPKTITVTAAEKGVTLTTNYSQISVGGVATLTVKPTGYVAGTDYDYVSWTVSQNGAVVSMIGTTNTLTNTATGLAAGTATITASLMKNNVANPVATTNSVSITVKNNAVTISTVQNGSAISRYDLAGYGSYVTLYANIANANTSGYSYYWSTPNNNVISLDYNYNNYVHIQALSVGQTTLTVTVTQNNATIGTASIPVTVGQSGLQPSVTVSGYTDYLFSERDSLNKSSVVSQIESLVSNYSGRRLYSVVFSNVDSTYGNLSATRNGTYYADGVTTSTGGRLSDIVFSPRQVGKATFSFSAYYSLNGIVQNNSPLSGVLTIEVKDGVSSSGDITYTADLGKDVAFDLRDFEDYYYNKTRGTLSYVTFTLPSGGALYYDGGRLPSSNSCYASPSRTQIDLAGIYFTPTGTTATRPSSVRINFTAYGSRYNNGTSGTVVINYLSGSARDITYTPSGRSISLRASDFTEAYRQAVGSTAPSGLTIQFQDVPSYGTLTYKDSSRSNSSTVTLRSSNIKNYKFTTRSSGSNQLADVTYTPSGSRNESITYIAYNGNTPQFTGKVVFNPTVVDNNMSVTFSGGQTITLDYQRFVQANASVMASTTRIRFMSLPVYGTLTYNGATVSAAGTDIVPSLLGNVVYRSSSATTVTDKVVFTCYNAAGDVVGGGQVNLNSTGTGGNNGGVTNISQFKDVKADAWYASDLSILLSRGIMQGKLEGKFDPLGQLKYGEALKIFLLSAGYSAQEGTGKDWAAGYKTLAVNNGWISSDVDLDAKITRNAMAELAAKVLGLSANSTVPPTWKDGTSNGYANALYYTSPQILVGNADGTFKGNDTLQRQEICKIAARVLTYKSNQQSSQLPGWLS